MECSIEDKNNIFKALVELLNLIEKTAVTIREILGVRGEAISSSKLPELPPCLIRVLKVLLEAQDWLTVDEISKRLGISPETAYRYIMHLHIMGLVVKQRTNVGTKCGSRSHFVNRIYHINPSRWKQIEELIR